MLFTCVAFVECTEDWTDWRRNTSAELAVRRLIRMQSMRLGKPVAVVAAVVWRRLAVGVTKGPARYLLRAHPEKLSGLT